MASRLCRDLDASIGSVLIVDDSSVARSALGQIVDATSRFVVAGSVGNARDALIFLQRHQVEIILLDLEMPGIDGLTALPELIAAGRGAKVLVVSAAAGDGATSTIQALALGAADTLVKPTGGAFATRFAEEVEERLARLLDSVPDTAPPIPISPSSVPGPQLPRIAPFDIVAIGASTGGIHALSKLLRPLPSSFTTPILITQHLPATFMHYFAAQLSLIAGRPCEIARDLMRIRPGNIIIAPGDAHMRVTAMSDGAVIRLTHEASVSGCMPSVDPMFESLAKAFGSRALGIVLSGMGKDGRIGARSLIGTGASVVVQDRGSSVVWGMPGAVANDGGVSAMLPPEAIGRLLVNAQVRR